MAAALGAEPTLRGGMHRLLTEAAAAYIRPGHPRGCLVISSATNCSSPDIQQLLRAVRNASVAGLEKAITAAVDAGELTTSANPRALSVFIASVMQGMAQQARDGASRQDLQATAKVATSAWPWA